MRRVIMAVAIIFALAVPVGAMEFTAPSVPESGANYLSDEPETFAEGLWSILQEAIAYLHPSLAEAAGICGGLIGIQLLCVLIQNFPGNSKRAVQLAMTLAIATLLLRPANAMIQLGIKTVTELSEYGKLLLPVMTAAMAAQGAGVSSTALYTGTAIFNALLCALISNLIVPVVYGYLGLSVANSAIGENILQKLRDLLKWFMTWSLKIVLYVFTGYMTITGVVSGSADAMAIKATKLTISGMVPVVGSILSDASETILVGAGVMKNAVGVYGMLAILAVWIGPFVRIGVQYILLKITAGICSAIGGKTSVKLIDDFGKAMGILLGMTSAVGLLLLISTACFMKGVG